METESPKKGMSPQMKVALPIIIVGAVIWLGSLAGNKSTTTSTSPSTSSSSQKNEVKELTPEEKGAAEAQEKADAEKRAADEAAKKLADSQPAEYKAALKKAASYANTMHMSKQGVYDQLVSEYGEQFSPEAAQYGIDNVKADWNANALAKAKSYQDTMSMSPAAIRDQLVSAYGEKFTASEADYAIQHLSD